MPKRTDIKTILLIGSGPIVIGQACEFDYSGTQAIKALKEEGYRVVLVNSNPATIMTDPEFADRTYIEPITPDFIEEIIRVEKPDAVLPTMGGQTALNAALDLDARGVFKRYQCELIGANVTAIKTAEDRELFRSAMDEIGLESAKSGLARSVEDAEMIAEIIGYPLILRPSRTLGGSGGGIVHDASELKRKVSLALSLSPNKEVLIEESLIGWKELELEVMRDKKDNVVIVCSIENFDPMGVHTGDSITVAPIQTLTDKEYQRVRDAAIKVMRRIGVDTGGSNVQFAINPDNGRLIVIEMNPRVSRSSALASKATGFPIAKIAAKLAVGYTLDEISNDITRETPACFEPSIDYTVVKIPRFNFEKFPAADNRLGTQMKAVGEVMAFGRTFNEALQKAMCSMELGSYGFDRPQLVRDLGKQEILELCGKPTPDRLWVVGEALRAGHSLDAIYRVSGIDPWFLSQIQEIILTEEECKAGRLSLSQDVKVLKHLGFSDRRLAALFGLNEDAVRKVREASKVQPIFKRVDTCAAEFEAHTPYLYAAYDEETEAAPSQKPKIIILGSGPNRIGQGIEFDYCCVHAVQALRADGYEAVMVNCNPETVSTDYDISDRLYFEPLTFEAVMNVVRREQPLKGVIVQFGGQTPLKLAQSLEKAGVPIIGTSVNSIDVAEDRERFSQLVDQMKLRQPASACARSPEEAFAAAKKLGYPIMLRPSFVLGGRAMRIAYSDDDLKSYVTETVQVSEERAVLLDRFLFNAVEVDVDVVSDGSDVIVCGVMEHIERAGIHSGDSSCCIPPQTLSATVIAEMKRQAVVLARELNVVGLMNIQYAVMRADPSSGHSEDTVYILEVNPRASRTVPFVSKATGIPWAKVAARVMAGKKLSELSVTERTELPGVAVKACVFPFAKFEGVDTILGPEMKSTGEVMGLHADFGGSFAKAQRAGQVRLPLSGKVFLSVADSDKPELPQLAKQFSDLGFELVATHGTAELIAKAGLTVIAVNKVREGPPHIVDMLGRGEIALVINTPEPMNSKKDRTPNLGVILDSRSIRLVANEIGIPTYTTMSASQAAAQAIAALKGDKVLSVTALQDFHQKLTSGVKKSGGGRSSHGQLSCASA